MLGPVPRLLSEQTASSQEQIRAALGLLEPELSRLRLRAVLARFAGYWQSAERRVDGWAIERPDEAAAVQWPRRRRVEILHQDLLRLGMSVRAVTELPEPAAQPFASTTPTDAEAYAWVYVSEAATVGDAVIDAAAELAAPDSPLADVGVFQPYAEGPEPLWQSYAGQLQAWAGENAERRDAVVAAARGTFDALEQWLLPVSLYAPAGRRL